MIDLGSEACLLHVIDPANTAAAVFVFKNIEGRVCERLAQGGTGSNKEYQADK
jgi:hypothetical protein